MTMTMGMGNGKEFVSGRGAGASWGLGVVLGLGLMVACGGGGAGTGAGGAGGRGGATGGSASGGGTGGSGATPGGTRGGGGTSAREAAVRAVVALDPACTSLPAFYWELGDASGALLSGKVGNLFDADTIISIASASKLVFGAYVVERFKSDLTRIDHRAITMQSGYTSLDYSSCVNAATVGDCLATGDNGVHTAANDGQFFYNGGHFQKYAVDLGLGADDNAALTTAILGVLGPELALSFGSPQLAGGMRASASGYAVFLRKLLKGGLALRDHLGEQAVCTLPGVCATAVSSPVSLPWHYSYGHWVEDEPGTGDGAFSSAGAFGFYPWVDASKTYYGLVARYALRDDASLGSFLCGRAIRKAFLTAPPP